MQAAHGTTGRLLKPALDQHDATVRIFTTHTVMLWYDEFVDRNVYDKSIIVDTNTVLL